MEFAKFYNKRWFKLVKYLAIFLIMFVSNKAGLNGLIYPFVFGLFFGFLWCNQNIFILCFLYILSGYLATFSYINVIVNTSFCLLSLIFYGIHYKLKKPIKLTNILIYACVCSIPKIAIEFVINNANIYLLFVEFLFGLLYTFACIKFFECVCVRGICNRLTTIETICAMSFVVSMFCGLSAFNIGSVQFVVFFGAIGILIVSYTTNLATTLLIGISMGIGCLLYQNNTLICCVLIIYAITSCLFRTKNKYITAVALIFADCLCGFYLKLYLNYSVFNIIPVLSACLVYILIPYGLLDRYSNEFLDNLASMTQQSVINRNREMLYYRLVELSDVFLEMNKVFRGMISGGLINSDAKRLILNEVKSKNCKDCPSHNKCYNLFSDETSKSLCSMIDSGFDKGKINLLDVPTIFAGKCDKLNSMVGSINDYIDQYKSYAGLINNIDASKVLLSEQLGGVSNIMKELSQEVNKGVKFEKGKEKRIIDELTYNNVICSDALVFQDNEDILSVTLAVRKDDAKKKVIAKIVSRVCGHSMEVFDDISSTRAGWQVLTLKSAPKFDVIFGIASRTKTGSIKSGDSFSVIKIKDGKYLFAICDGMGSGEKAEQTSSTALGLLENFYKAGFDKDIIISSVNKLLSLGKDDIFSALDLCVIDTKNGIGDFIKMGAPEAFVKHKDTTDIIKIGALPLGIIQNVESRAKEVYFTSGDKIVLVSDGVSDGFKSVDDLQDFINNISSQSPQAIADQIIQKVLNLNNNIARDDMTVIVAKIFEK